MKTLSAYFKSMAVPIAIALLAFSTFGLSYVTRILRERNLAVEERADRRISDGHTKLSWADLRGLKVTTGKRTGRIQHIAGKVVKIPGFIVPLQDEMESVSEFLLVPYPRACIHVPAPPANQIVHVKMRPGRRVKMNWYDPIWIIGTLKVQRSRSDLADAAYTMVGMTTAPYRLRKDPDGGAERSPSGAASGSRGAYP